MSFLSRIGPGLSLGYTSRSEEMKETEFSSTKSHQRGVYSTPANIKDDAHLAVNYCCKALF